MEQDKVVAYIEEQAIYQVDSNGVKYWSCGLCHKTLSNKSQTRRHIESYHVQTNPYYCNQCAEQFTTQRGIQRHITANHR